MTTPLSRPLTRRIGDLIIRLTPDGLQIRGFKRRKWITLTWEQVASLEPDVGTIQNACERRAGKRVLAEIGAGLPARERERERETICPKSETLAA